MTLITWSWVPHTRFLPPPPRTASGLLTMVNIALLVIVWVTTFRTPFSHQKSQVLLSKFWKTSTKFLTFSLNVQTLLHLLFSLNYLILPQVTTSQLVGLRWDHRLWVLNVSPRNYHNPLALLAIFSLLSLTSMLWRFQNIPLTNCKIWIIIIHIFKKFSSY